MAGFDFVIAGMGPAGVAAAYRLSKLGYRVALLESNSRPAGKPCGWGLPEADWLPVPVPKEAIVERIRGARLLVDGREAVEVEGWLRGYIINKPRFLEAIASDAGVEVFYRAPLLLRRRQARLPGRGLVDVDLQRTIAATGVAYYDKEKIVAVEYLVHATEGCFDRSTLLIDFDTRIVGYYWLFPSTNGLYQVGAGGYTDASTLLRALERWIEHLGCPIRRASTPRGAPIAVGGLSLRRLNGVPLAGEAAGFVLPLTGEGIRPSMASGAAAADALARGRDPLEAQAATRAARAVRVQRRILERVKSMEPSRRAELLSSIPARVHAEVALGTLRLGVIARELAGRPRLAARLLRLLS